ncbi:hypothetical protein AMAG_19409 [Allomyces macrogynus ATCC 38327]|uniref:Uncharacterized protein n=1 Tax=Allomyces macrogynus (strain ATCC 38327) TaxID=578462 RepID=A0A0L0SR59_ALLM3|nr:hypothetical protein AMAG_19409 [Allomyces macrogynus ATCC 38327]|eukprot:KNE64997.1 hypothetical protein AMAG_19409 [Allomyces macrogynus ATCC 38327]
MDRNKGSCRRQAPLRFVNRSDGYYDAFMAPYYSKGCYPLPAGTSTFSITMVAFLRLDETDNWLNFVPLLWPCPDLVAVDPSPTEITTTTTPTPTTPPEPVPPLKA